MAEVTFIGVSASLEAPPVPAIKPAAVTIEMPTFETVSSETPAAPIATPEKGADPLASIMALKEEERLALFT